MGGVGSREYESGLAARAHQRARGMGSSGMADTLALEPEHTFGKASSGDGRDARGRVRRPGQKFDGSAELRAGSQPPFPKHALTFVQAAVVRLTALLTL